ncbi:hypothetical protein FPV67DRAFT_1669349 [Lyophyllum atratum]|nr:hypothetical protein FPV67DRAFT_1669349 [Lyophyllum atratum]
MPTSAFLLTPPNTGVGGFETSSSYHVNNRLAIEEELIGRLRFDDERVLQRLRVDDVDQDLVQICSVTFKTDNKESIMELEALEEAREWQRHDIDMYDPLDEIFQYIDKLAGATTKRPEDPRKFQQQNNQNLSEDSHTIGFPKEKAAFSLFQPTGIRSQRWCDRDGFCQAKPTKTQGPKPRPGHDAVVNDLVAQTAEYARLHMSSRPFLLFSVGLLIFGSDFCIAICDREGITFSPIKNMWDDTKDFIRIVISMTTLLSDVELGQDPTVAKLPSQVSDAIEKGTYPSYMISAVGDDARRWCTVGPPMWSSLSLFGRGTAVWRVREYFKNTAPDSTTEKVLKTAWRVPNRTPEAQIYEAIQGTPPGGLAEFLTGGDVYVGKDPITVSFLREGHNRSRGTSPVLHRVLLNTVGRPLWEYSSEIELLQAIRAATCAHRFLWDQGILHRDISAGNILLSNDFSAAQEGSEGFLTDFEFARLPSEIRQREQVPPPANIEAKTETKTKFYDHQGAVISGTLLFMARELLYGIKTKSQVK